MPGMGGGATKETAAPEAQHLVSEIDNSKSFVHLNVHTPFILGVVSLVILVIILLLLPCMCCKNVGRVCRWCCSGCQATEMQQTPRTPWGVGLWSNFWPNRIRYTQQDLEAWKNALPHQQHNPQGPSALSRPRPASEPTWTGDRIYPSVPLATPNSLESSTEDLP